MLNKEYKLGLRAIKTGISVLICLFLAYILKRPDGFFASIAAIICMQQTINKSFSAGVHRLLGTFVGGVFGYFILLFFKNFKDYKDLINMIAAPIFILIIIYISNFTGYKASSQIACVVMLSLTINPREFSEAHTYVINRILDTSMGVIVAVLVNRLVFPSKSLK